VRVVAATNVDLRAALEGQLATGWRTLMPPARAVGSQGTAQGVRCQAATATKKGGRDDCRGSEAAAVRPRQ
ncbi:MAG: hypothetical protein ACK533_03335, partial [Planctomycetota bacterium]